MLGPTPNAPAPLSNRPENDVAWSAALPNMLMVGKRSAVAMPIPADRVHEPTEDELFGDYRRRHGR